MIKVGKSGFSKGECLIKVINLILFAFHQFHQDADQPVECKLKDVIKDNVSGSSKELLIKVINLTLVKFHYLPRIFLGQGC